MPIPFLSSINLTKNEVENFKIYNLANDPGTLTSGGDFGYFWLNTTNSGGTIPTLKWWDGTNVRSLVDSTNIGSFTSGLATDLAGGGAGQIVYQDGVNDTKFLAAGTAGQVLSSNGASAPSWLNQSSLSVGSATAATTATNVAGGANGSILVQSGVGTTGQLSIGASGYILTSNGTTPGWSATIPSTSVSGLAASATTDTTNASNISSGTLGLARLSLATGQFYVGDASNNPAATAKSSIPLSGFGAAGADVAMGGFKITGLADPAAATDAATRGYVDSVAQGLDVKASCLVATTADITLSSPGAISIDNIPSTSFTAGTTRILVRAQNTASQNGIYIWNGSGSAMTRSADANTWDELVSAFTFIEQGDTLKDTGWVCTIDAGTLGTTAVTWSQFSGAGSYTANRGLVLSGSAFNFAQNSDYAIGDLPYATGQTTIGLLPAVATGNALISGGVTTAPSWGKIGLTTHVSGTLPVANGGTGASTFTQGQVLFAGASAISSSANLFWDNANNRLGIGTATPAYPLSVNGRISYSGAIGEGADTTLSSSGTVLLHGNSSTWTEQRFYAAGNEQHRIASSGVFTWYDGGGAGGTRMTLNGTGLGVGVAPTERLTVWGGSNVYGDSRFNVGLFDPTSAALGTGSGISFGGYTNGVTVGATFAQIKGIKENGTAGNIAGAFAISTLPNGGIPTERLRIASDGVCTWSNVGGVVSNAMVLNGTGLGVGVVPSVGKLEVNLENGASNSAYFRTTTYTNLRIVGTSGSGATGGSQAFFTTTGNRDWVIGQRTDTVYSSANSFFIRDESASATRLTIDTSGNVGIGTTSPATKLMVASGYSGYGGAALTSNGAILTVAGLRDSTIRVDGGVYQDGVSTANLHLSNSAANNYNALNSGFRIQANYNGSNGAGYFAIDSSSYTGTAYTYTERLRIDGGGNLGLGVTPSAFDATFGRALQFNGGSIYSYSSTQLNLLHNIYFDGSSFKYVNTAPASSYRQVAGVHSWSVAASGTAGTGVSMTAAMTLDASGNLLVGTVSPSVAGVVVESRRDQNSASRIVTNNQNSGASALSGIGFEAYGGSWQIDVPSSTTFVNPIEFKFNGTKFLSIKSTGQVNFVGQASDPAGAAGDVYYNSGSNVFKVYDTGWKTLPRKYSTALAGTSTTFDVTHNLGTQDVTVMVRKSASTFDVVYTDIQVATTNKVTIVFASSVTGSDYTVTVIG